MTDKQIQDPCDKCGVEPPAMKCKCPECEHNPDKEQIMIDGCNVSECVSFDKLNGQNICCYEDTREDKIPFANFCVENKDCYFKQLIRKTQECEALKSESFTRESLISMQEKDIDRYRKALEEIEDFRKKHCDFLCEGNRILDIINKAKGEGDD